MMHGLDYGRWSKRNWWNWRKEEIDGMNENESTWNGGREDDYSDTKKEEEKRKDLEGIEREERERN